MRIGINGQILFIDEIEKTGPVTYLTNLLIGISKIDNKSSFIVYLSNRINKKNFANFKSKFPQNFEFKVLPNSISWMQFSLAKELLSSPLDIFFTSTHSIPFLHNPKLKIVSMIHGLEYKTNRQYINSPIKAFIHPLILSGVLKFSQIIITPSQATKDAILKSFSIDSQKIQVIPEGVSDDFYKRTPREISDIRTKYKLGDSKYLFFVSRIQPRKNIPKMIEGFGNAIKENPSIRDIKLVIAGKNGWMYEESLEAPSKFGISENVIFTGQVPDEDLPILFSGAHAFISCSLEEGFGLPLLESLACETPAMVSDIPAFREIGEDKIIYINPNDVKSIKHGFLEIISHPLTKNLDSLARKYTWEKTAEKTLKLLIKQ
ncbi:hypothetical protein COV25_03520 [candidate division WWE3 bacterium CG10_big_fil_rev_8_21_14_0_10_35_32]|nr:MAG: hypothetical protein COV25_03520 [candidate division WWE3 bacterium CG10_big_fil_rev_8_21_14_0_10_35_32]